LLRWCSETIGLSLPVTLLTNIQLMTYGGLILIFLIIEPLGLAKIYFNVRNYFLVWPFAYTKRQV